MTYFRDDEETPRWVIRTTETLAMWFSWIKSAGWSGRVHALRSEKPWGPETKLSKDYSAVSFQKQLEPGDEALSLDELTTKYPKPERKG